MSVRRNAYVIHGGVGTTPLTDRDKVHILEQRSNKQNGKYRCLDCGEVKTLDNFYKTTLDNGRLKVKPHCKACERKKKANIYGKEN